MTNVFSADQIDPGEIGERERRGLGQALYRVHKAVFSGLDENQFCHYVVDSPAARTRIFLYRDQRAELVGYLGVHRFEKTLNGQAFVIFRAEAGLLPGYRQKDANLCYWLLEAARFKLLNPGKAVYFLYVPVSPSFYAMVARYCHQVYPRYNSAVPADTLALMTRFAREFGLEEIEAGTPLVRRVGWIVKATHQEEEFWQSSLNPHIRFYIDTNPHFAQGHGLLTLIPITLANVALSLPGIAFQTARKKLRGMF